MDDDSNYWSGRFSRRGLLRSGAVMGTGVAAAAIIGCGDDDDDGGDGGGQSTPGTSTPGASTPGTSTPGGTAPAETGRGGTFRYGLLSEIASLDPHVFITVHTDTIWQVWDSVTEYDKSIEPVGRLAESWEINDDSTEFIFHLRDGVKWHSGRDFTAEDIRYNLDRVTNPVEGAYGGASQLRLMAEWYNENVETPDDHTLIMKTSIPRPAVFDFWSQFRIGDHESLEGPNALTTAGGTGPFQFVEWRQGERFNLVKNPNYWDPARPLLDEQIFMTGLDAESSVAQFEAGALDGLQDPADSSFVRLQDEYQGLIHQSSGAYYCVGYNCVASAGTPEAFKDARVRQALNWAIDRDRFAQVVLQGLVEPYSLPWPEGSVAYEADKVQHYQLDLEKAKQLLTAAGVDQMDTGIFVYTGLPAQVQFAELYQADLATIGVNAAIEAVEVATWASRVNESPPNYNGIYAANSGRANFSVPVTMANLGPALWDATGRNNTGYASEAWQEVLDELNLTSDPVRQKELTSRMNDILLEDTWITFQAPRPPKAVLQNNVHGVYNYFTREGFEFADAWIED